VVVISGLPFCFNGVHWNFVCYATKRQLLTFFCLVLPLLRTRNKAAEMWYCVSLFIMTSSQHASINAVIDSSDYCKAKWLGCPLILTTFWITLCVIIQRNRWHALIIVCSINIKVWQVTSKHQWRVCYSVFSSVLFSGDQKQFHFNPSSITVRFYCNIHFASILDSWVT
jgi:hypothetical protein